MNLKKKGLVKGHGKAKGTKIHAKLPNKITKGGKAERGVRVGHKQKKPAYLSDTDKQLHAQGPAETGSTQQSAYRRSDSLTG